MLHPPCNKSVKMDLIDLDEDTITKACGRGGDCSRLNQILTEMDGMNSKKNVSGAPELATIPWFRKQLQIP
jgi:hypothetical protein